MLNISVTCRKPLDNINKRLESVGEGPLTRLGGLEPRIHEGGWFSTQNLKSSPVGLILVGPVENHLVVVVEK